jgi:transcription termination factor Rho
VTDTTDFAAAPAADESPRRSGGLSTMRLAELQGLASSLGLSGTAKMRKGDLVTAIRARQSGGPAAAAPVAATERTASGPSSASGAQAAAPAQEVATAAPTGRAARTSRRAGRPAGSADAAQGGQEAGAPSDNGAQGAQDTQDTRSADVREARAGAPVQDEASAPQQPRGERGQNEQGEQGEGNRSRGRGRDDRSDARADTRGERTDHRADYRGDRSDYRNDNRSDSRNDDRSERRGDRADNRGEGRADRSDNRGENRGDFADNRGENRGDRSDNRSDNRSDTRSDNRSDNRTDGRPDNRNEGGSRYDRDNRSTRGNDGDDDERGGRRRNRQRSRDRKRGGTRREGEGFGSGSYGSGSEQAETIHDDDVLIPVAGILDVLDNYAFVRTSGYLPGDNDVYVPLGIVKKNGLRKGDAVTGAVKALAEGEQPPARQKFNALVRLDTVNGKTPEESRGRVEFGKLTPLYPQERLRLETDQNILSTRLIDLIAPIGKGQRGLIVSPPKAGKTLILQAIANAITVNNPEAHLMIVLVDERPEEVTDMQRTVKGEVIASTFDRPATDHTTVAELAIERAKRLVELGHDVVVLLDSITRLGRAYNLAAPASGRILSGGVDSSALYPPKRFFGAARNIEHGGSLTILATALVETGSKMDEVIFEEFKGTGNMELRLSRSLADRRIFPAIDVNPSGTRREEILMAGEELKIVWKLRRVLSALDQQQGIELLIDRLKKSKSNVEFLMQVQKTSSIQMDDDA